MILTYIAFIFSFLCFSDSFALDGNIRENKVLIEVIENSIGKSVIYFYNQLEINSLHPENFSVTAIEDEDHQVFGVEMKILIEKQKNNSEIVIRVRFDLRKQMSDSLLEKYQLNLKKQPVIIQKNGNFTIEFIRVLEYKNNKVIYNRIFDKSTGFYISPTADYISNRKSNHRK
ncbi:MAG: hypothetical protein JST20_04440 [Bacteroidetes bacterium]|nr:hypothetical protein [Bacteroidota bacterium]